MLKKVILLFAVLSGSASAQSVTPNIGLQLPAYNSSNWGTQLNYDLTRLDGYLSGGYTIPNLSISTLTTPTVNATVNGYQINGTAPLNHFLIGNGTYYVDTAQIPAGSLPSSYTNFQLFGTPPFIGFAATAGGSNYAGLTSPSTGVFDFGNGTAGNSSGTLNAATLTATASVTTPIVKGNDAATFAAGSGAGTSPSAATCFPGYTCTASSGTVSITTGTSPNNTAALITVSFTALPAAYANCVVSGFGTSAGATILPYIGGSNATSFSIWTGNTPAASPLYEFSYVCQQ